MMNFSLRLVTPPVVEPVTVEEVKLHTRIPYDDEDSLIQKWITAGRIAAEDFQRRAYIAQEWEMWFENFPADVFRLHRAPLLNVSKVSYFDVYENETIIYSNDHDPAYIPEVVGTSTTTTTAAPDVIVDTGLIYVDDKNEPGKIGLKYGMAWPAQVLRNGNAFCVRYWSGYGATAATVPDTVKDAIMLYCAYRNENRAGEVAEVPDHFYNLLYPGWLYTP